MRLEEFDRQHLWHPYASIGTHAADSLLVKSARGTSLYLENNNSLIDGMSSWWCAIHGYNHPVLNAAAQEQLQSMSHVMFGGLTHHPAINLGKLLLEIVPPQLTKIFYCDSGSVAVEIAMKMAFQYWRGRGETRGKILALRGAYHGDTFAAMAVCDPINGMHKHFAPLLTNHIFAPRPQARFGKDEAPADRQALEAILRSQHHEIAAIIIEPILQGAGGMWFYSADYVRTIRELATQYGIPLIADEIATGFGRTGRLFACEHAGISPDILCLGKALSGGYISLAAVLCNDDIAASIIMDEPKSLQHGPTFMANPLACAIAHASVQLLLDGLWKKQVANIERILHKELDPLRAHPAVSDVRCLGATGVIEFKENPDHAKLQAEVVKHGVWLRPFGKLLYTMPPYLINETDLKRITHAMSASLSVLC